MSKNKPIKFLYTSIYKELFSLKCFYKALNN
jgi:hypothetical protein